MFSKISNLSEEKHKVKVEENKVTEATLVSKILNTLVLYFFFVISTSICFPVGINWLFTHIYNEKFLRI